MDFKNNREIDDKISVKIIVYMLKSLIDIKPTEKNICAKLKLKRPYIKFLLIVDSLSFAYIRKTSPNNENIRPNNINMKYAKLVLFSMYPLIAINTNNILVIVLDIPR